MTAQIIETCVTPRRSPAERASDAVESIAFELITLEDALRAGAALSLAKRDALQAIAARIGRLPC